MSWIDWLIIGLVIYNVGSGLFTGLLRSLLNVAALVTAYLLTPVLKLPLSQLLQSVLELPPYLTLPLSTTLTWGGVYVAISALGLIFVKSMDQTLLKPIDRLGGALLGLGMSALLVLLPLSAIKALPFLQKIPAIEAQLARSSLVPVLMPAVTVAEQTIGPWILDYWLKQREQDRMEQTLPGAKPTAQPTTAPSDKPAPAPARQP